MRAPHFQTGSKGESAALQHIRSLGYAVLGTNVRVGKHYELDIIARDPVDDVVVFIEVKARSKSDADYHAELNLTYDKRRRISNAARWWVAQKGYEGGYRLDLVCVEEGKVVRHLQDIDFS